MLHNCNRHWKLDAKNCVLRKPLLTIGGGFLLEKLAVLQLVEKSPTFHGTLRCITVFTGVNQLIHVILVL